MVNSPIGGPCKAMLLLAACAMLAACGRTAPAPDNMAAPAPSAAPQPGHVAGPANVASAPSTQWVLTSEGMGPLRIGMTVAEIEAVAGADDDPAAIGGPEPEQCDQYHPARAPAGVLVMVEDGRLTRVSLIDGATATTERGITVGAAAARVREAYGAQLREEPHKYRARPAAYLTAWASRGSAAADAPYVEDRVARGVRYETDEQQRVTIIHGGGPSIQYVEGCA